MSLSCCYHMTSVRHNKGTCLPASSVYVHASVRSVWWKCFQGRCRVLATIQKTGCQISRDKITCHNNYCACTIAMWLHLFRHQTSSFDTLTSLSYGCICPGAHPSASTFRRWPCTWKPSASFFCCSYSTQPTFSVRSCLFL